MGNFSSIPLLTDVYNTDAAEGDMPWVVVGELPSKKIIVDINNSGRTRYEFYDTDEDEE